MKVTATRTGDLFRALQPEVVTDDAVDLLIPRYNIAPAQPVLAVRTWAREGDTAERRLDALRWGLIPSWAKDPAIGGRLVNARAETVAERPSFRGAWREARRCLVLADLFSEWHDVGGAAADPRNRDSGKRTAKAPRRPKQPYAIRLTDDAPFAFAGLWEAWRDPEVADGDAPGAWVATCTLITTTPNALMRRIRDRMPVIVPRARYDAWLDPALPLDEAEAMLKPYAASAMRSYPVTTYVNSPLNEGPEALEPTESGL